MIKQTPQSKEYWCHSCKSQFFSSMEQVRCPVCSEDFCEEVNEQNNPKNYVPFKLKKQKPKNLTKHLQVSYFTSRQEPIIIANQELLQRIHTLLASQSKGSPPASKTEIEKLKRYEYTGEELRECSICQEEFTNQCKTIQMPCEHKFHEACILTWLEHRNSCPECRFQLKTDDPNYQSKNTNTLL